MNGSENIISIDHFLPTNTEYKTDFLNTREVVLVPRSKHTLLVQEYDYYFYHGLLPVRQSHGHGASCLMWGPLTSGEVGFGEPWVSAVSALVFVDIYLLV